MAKQVVGFEIVIDGLGRTIETATELKRAIAFVNEEIKKTSDVQELKKLEAKLIDLKAAQMEVNKVVREQIKTRNEEITATDKVNGAYRKLSKELNDQRNRYKDLAAAEQDSSQEAKDLLVSINALDKKLKGIDATVGQFQRNVGGYTEALSQFFPKLGGTIGNVTGLVGDLSSGFANLGKTTGIANIGLGTVGLALAAFEGISNIIADIKQSVKEVTDLKIAFENFGFAGQQLDNVAAKAQSLGEVFEENSTQVAVAANTISREFGIPIEKAFDIIQAGFLKGADAQGEFLDTLREYPAQFRDAGLSAEEFLKVSIAAGREGIYSDKGLDVIKEFGLRIREQTSASKDALINAFGEDFTSQLFANLNTGAVTSGQALGLITKKINETGLSGEKLQKVVADVFGGPGEDVGQRLLLSLGDILTSTNDVTTAETKLQKQSLELIKVKEISALRNAKLAESTREADLETTKFSEDIRSFLGESLNFLVGAFLSSEVSIGKFNDRLATSNELIKDNKKLNATATKTPAQLSKERQQFEESEEKKREAILNNAKKETILRTQTEAGIEKALDEIKAKRKSIVFGTPEFKKADEEIKRLEKELEKFNPKESGKKGGETFVKSFTAGSLAKLQDEQSKLQKAFGEAVVGSGTQKEIGVKLNAINNQIKDAIEQQNQILADASRGNLLKNLQQAQQLATLPLTVKPLKSIKQSDLDKKEAEDIKKVQQDIIKSSNEANQKRIDNEKKAQEELYENRQKNIELAGQGALLLTDLFSTIQSAKFKKDEEALNKQIQLTEENIATLEAKADKATGLRKKKIEKDLANEKLLLEAKNKQQQELQLKAAKQEKKIAIAQSIIQGALAVQRALNSFPFPPLSTGQAIAAGIFAGIQTATIIAQPLAEGGVVTGQRINQKQNIPTRSNGDNVLAFVKRGEVVLNQRQQALLGGSPTFRKIGIKGFADGGLVAPIS